MADGLNEGGKKLSIVKGTGSGQGKAGARGGYKVKLTPKGTKASKMPKAKKGQPAKPQSMKAMRGTVKPRAFSKYKK